jgi:DNA-binding response OmpR family regulator
VTDSAILLVTDDESLAASVVMASESCGYQLCWERRVTQGLAACVSGNPALVVVDVGAHGVAFPGFAQELRRLSPIPLIAISIDRDPVAAARLLDSGADDCVGRPVEPSELVARIRAVLRRIRRPPALLDRPLEVGDMRIEPTTRSVSVKGHVIHCTAIEYDILEPLARHAGTVVSREALAIAACGRDPTPLDRALDVHISHLRRKLRHLGPRIVTVRGVGYMLAVATAPS